MYLSTIKSKNCDPHAYFDLTWANAPQSGSSSHNFSKSWPWPLTRWIKISRVPPLIWTIFEKDQAKILFWIAPTRYWYICITGSAKDDLDLRTRDPKSISLHYHRQLTCKVTCGSVRAKLSCLQCFTGGFRSWPLTSWPKVNGFLL